MRIEGAKNAVSTLTNSVNTTSGLPCLAVMNRKAASVTPSMGESPMMGLPIVCQKFMVYGPRTRCRYTTFLIKLTLLHKTKDPSIAANHRTMLTLMINIVKPSPITESALLHPECRSDCRGSYFARSLRRVAQFFVLFHAKLQVSHFEPWSVSTIIRETINRASGHRALYTTHGALRVLVGLGKLHRR